MRVVVLGGTWFLGRRVVERLHERGDEVLVVHRGRSTPPDWVPVRHLLCDRAELASRVVDVRDFDPEVVVDTCALAGSDVDAVLPILSGLPAVVLSSQDVYEAHAGLRRGSDVAALPLDEDSEVRRERYPYRGLGIESVPDDYEKLDVEERWLAHGATVLRLPLIYGPMTGRDVRSRCYGVCGPGVPRSPWDQPTCCGRGDTSTISLLGCSQRSTPAPLTRTLGWWSERIIAATDGPAELVRVQDAALPADLALSGAASQHLLVSVARAERLLGWRPEAAERRIEESVRWHLDHPPEGTTWTDDDAVADDAALESRV